MELTHDFTVPAPIDSAWATFMDLERVGGCFPGATVTSVTADGFTGTVKVKLGPIALVYAGSGQFLERDDTAHRAVIEAKGKDKRGNGTAGATVTIHLSPSGAGTRVDVMTDLAITGKPAQFGRGVMQDVSDKLLQQFVGCIEGQFASAEEAADSAAAQPGSMSPGAQEHSAPGGSTEGGVSLAAATPAVGGAGAATSRPAASAGEDGAIDLGATVLPVVLRAYAPYAAAALAGLALGILLGRRRR